MGMIFSYNLQATSPSINSYTCRKQVNHSISLVSGSNTLFFLFRLDVALRGSHKLIETDKPLNEA